MAKTFTKEEVASHNKSEGLWIIIDEDVYDVTKFQEDHPGGFLVLSCSCSFSCASPVTMLMLFFMWYRWKEEYVLYIILTPDLRTLC